MSAPTLVFCDNQGAIRVIETGIIRPGARAIDVKFHHIVDEQKNGIVNFQYIRSARNPADVLTKGLETKKHEETFSLLSLGRLAENGGA